MKNKKREERINEIAKEVVKIKKSFAKSFKQQNNKDDSLETKLFNKVDCLPSPFEIAKLYGLKIVYGDIEGDVPSNLDLKKFTIYISNKYLSDNYAARHLCAHELGHFFLHKKSYAEMNIFPSKEMEEYEANVFSVLLMPQIMGGCEWECMEPKVLNDMMYKKIFKKSKVDS
ncbi:MAG: ImmA/IrrE family metallo-endopeptidase [Lachnospiraceae bacterium]|nr:ImmA/IrrE family metallo-endopeptidase [Lachnospiraceae bacterium]